MEEINYTNLTSVQVAGSSDKIYIPFTSGDKPAIPENIQKNWQSIVDTMAKVIDVPSCLITRIGNGYIEVAFRNGNRADNPFKKSEKFNLGTGIYCETVAGKRANILVADSRKDQIWKGNLDEKEFGMVSYYGVPVMWPDGEVFGTLCVLDHKENHYQEEYTDLVQLFKKGLENDLEWILLNSELKKSNELQRVQLQEINHRIKNNFNILISLINLESENISSVKEANPIEILTKISAKIRGIALIHEKLSRIENFNSLGISEYLKNLTRETLDSFGAANVVAKIDSSELMLKNKTLITCGLLINELLTNSIKHGLNEIETSEITIGLLEKDEVITISYYDNGSGFPKNFDLNAVESLGLTIAKGLADQLGSGLNFFHNSPDYFKFTIDIN